MSKVIDLGKTVAELIGQYPELKDIMARLGLKGVLNPVMLNTAGKIMTIPKGAESMGISMDKVKEVLKENGFEVKE